MKKNPLTVCTLIKSSCTDVCNWKKPFFLWSNSKDGHSVNRFHKWKVFLQVVVEDEHNTSKKEQTSEKIKQTVPWNWHNRPCIMQRNNTWLGKSMKRRAPRHNLSKYLKWFWCFRWYLQYISIIVYSCYRCLIDKVESIRLVACWKDLLSKV